MNCFSTSNDPRLNGHALDENTGTVALKGRDRAAVPAPHWRKKVAYVPAESGWWGETVREHVEETPELAGLLDAVGLGESLDWEIARLSTGERQRLALIRALQSEPDVLLLDEPTAALDPPTVKKVERLLTDRITSGCALLVVTHDPDQPARLGATQYQMNAGKLLPGDPGSAAA